MRFLLNLGNLRNMAVDMGSELDNQNRMIDRINAKVNIYFSIQYSLSIYIRSQHCTNEIYFSFQL